MTPQQENQLRIKAVQRGYDRQQVEAFVLFAKSKEQAAKPAEPAPKMDNPVKALAKDAFNALVVRPGTRIGQALVAPQAVESSRGLSEALGALEASRLKLERLIQATTEPARKAQLEAQMEQLSREIDNIKSRDTRAATVENRALQAQKVDLGPAGGYDNRTPDSYKQVAGEAAEAASYLYTPSRGVSIFKGSLTRRLLQTSVQSGKAGIVGGSLYAGGKEAQDPESTMGSIAIETLKGGATGGAAGAVLGPVIAGAGMALSKAKGVVQDTASKLRAEDSFVSRTQRRVQDALSKQADLKAQPPAVQRAAKVDIAPETSHFVIGMSKPDKTLAKTMLNMAKTAKDTLKPTSRPVEVPGRVILQPVNFIQRTRATSGKALGEIVQGMKPTPFQPTKAVEAFSEGLGELGISVGKGGKLNFAQSSITNATEQGILQRIARDLKIGKARPARLTPAQDHRMRQRIFGMLKTAKAKGELTYGQTVAEKVRSALKDDLVAATGKQGERYAAEAQKYAQAEDILKDFFALIGKKWEDKADDILALRAGEVGNRILGNASAAPLDVLTRLEAVAKQMGYKGRNNPVDLLIFNDLLEDLLGTTQTRSLRGQVSRGVRDAQGNLAGIAEDAVTGNKMGMVKKAVDFVKGITPEEQLRELERLLGL